MTQPSEVVPDWPVREPLQRKYDWSAWTDGQIHVLMRGTHFDVTMNRFYRSAWEWGDRHGYRLTFRTLSQLRCALRFVPVAGQVPE